VLLRVSDLEQRLRAVEDRLAIGELVARYGHAVDDRDFETLGRLFASDAFVEHALGRSTGRAAVLDFYRERLGGFGPTYHYPHSLVVELLSADEASGVVAAHAELAIGGETVVAGFRYHDRYVREDGAWRFRERVIRFLYVVPLAELPRALGEELRKRWPGTEPAPADLPPRAV
jgi:hypothetical protein